VAHEEHLHHVAHEEHLEHVAHEEHLDHLAHLRSEDAGTSGHAGDSGHAGNSGHAGDSERSTTQVSRSRPRPRLHLALAGGAAVVVIAAVAGTAIALTSHNKSGSGGGTPAAASATTSAAATTTTGGGGSGGGNGGGAAATTNFTASFSMIRHIISCNPAEDCITGPLPLTIRCQSDGSCTASSSHWASSHPGTLNGNTLSIAGVDTGVSGCDQPNQITMNLTVTAWSSGAIRKPLALSGPYDVSGPANANCSAWDLRATLSSQ
jgi:hypothetical protein